MSTAEQAGRSVRSVRGEPPAVDPGSEAARRGSTPAGTRAQDAAVQSAPAQPVTTPGASPGTTGGSGPVRAAGQPGVPAPRRQAGTRRVRLTVSRVDPWSAMKMSFLLSFALGIALVVMVAVLWTILAGMGVFSQINDLVGQIIQDGDKQFDILDFVGFGRVVSLSVVVGVIDIVLITAISTLGAFIYNVSSALVGGLQVTLTDD